jgi:hypothetical protein
MKRAIVMLVALVVWFGGREAKGNLLTYTDQALFNAQGTILRDSNFNDFGTGVSFPGDPFKRGGVTYTSGANVIEGTGTSYAPVENMMFYNYFTPLTATIKSGYNMLGADFGVLSLDGSNSLVDITVFTSNGHVHEFDGLPVSYASTGLTFLGAIETIPGVYITGFSVATENGPGWAAGLTNVELGVATPEPASITLLVLGCFAFGGFSLYRRHRRAAGSSTAC